MEFTTFSLYVSLLIFFLVILFKRNLRKTIINLPPGPKKLPIIGNLHQIISSSSSGNLIHHVLRDLSKKYGPLMHLKFGEVPTIVINSPEMAKEIYKTHDVVFAQRPTNLLVFKIISYNFSDIIFSPYGNYWKNLRKICIMELLNPKRVHSFRSIREDEVLNMIRKILLSLRDNNNHKEGETVVNLSQMIFALTYGITSRVAFGKRSKSQEKFEEHVVEINKMAAEAGFNFCDLYPSWKFLEIFSIGVKRKMEKVLNRVDEIIQEILDEHRQKMKNSDNNNNNNVGREDEEEDDIVDVLLRIQKNGDFEVPLTNINLKAVLFNIFSAGSETSSTTLEWAVSETLKNPRILKRAQEEVRNKFDERGNVDESSNISDLKYFEAIVKETLRLHPSAPLLLPRENSQHCKINGYDIPAKTRVIVNAWAIGRDPNFWTDEPEVFKPERFLDSEVIDYKGNHFQYIPFGAGRRICPGISFAVSNIMLPLAQLLFHFDWKISDDGERNYKQLEELDMEESLGVSVRRKTDLKLIPVPYHRSAIHT